MKIGYSFWGFLGTGIVDTPDGGRIHRLPFLKEIIKNDNIVICLQKNRDLVENNENIKVNNISFSDGFPEIDALFLEYRWSIPNRNCGIARNDKNYTPDLDRQNELIDFYSKKNIPIIIWDKDQKLSSKPYYASIVYESSWNKSGWKKQLLFSFDDTLRENSLNMLANYDKTSRIYDLVYIGNQYERDESFDKYINKAALYLATDTNVYGNWTKYESIYKENLLKFKNVIFKDRLAFSEIFSVYKKSFATVLIAPDRYYKSGQITQRIFEAISTLTIPLIPSEYNFIENLVLQAFIVHDGFKKTKKINFLKTLNNKELVNLLRKQILLLGVYSPKIQVKKLQQDLEILCKNI